MSTTLQRVVGRSARHVRACLLPLSSNRAAYSTGDSFLSGASANYAEAMEQAWRRDPTSVHTSWNAYFSGAEVTPAPAGGSAAASTGLSAAIAADLQEAFKCHTLIRAYETQGHMIAQVDPLKIDAEKKGTPSELALETYGFTEADLDRRMPLSKTNDIPSSVWQASYLGLVDNPTLRELVTRLKDIYASHIGVEYMHIPSREKRNWIREELNSKRTRVLSSEEKKRHMNRLVQSDGFERFLRTGRFRNEKRFGIEGCEALIPCLKQLIDTAAEEGIGNIVMGMPHRGRLNVLANVLHKPMQQIFNEFQGTNSMEEGSGDVKYHLGSSVDRLTSTGKQIHLSLVANPSHLETVNPVVEGKVRAEQFFLGDDQTHDKVMSVLMHGDAAFAGQGVVYETLGFSELPAYTTGGTIHVIVNNQVGFTTDPRSARSSPYCTDVAKTIGAPILHINGDSIEDVVWASETAVKWRQTFKTDIVLDIVCYRRYGHNEGDQPAFTQPKMYSLIDVHPWIRDIYADKLVNEKTCTREEIDTMIASYQQLCTESFEIARTSDHKLSDWLESKWSNFKRPSQFSGIEDTGVNLDILRTIGNVVSTGPEGMTLHPGITRVFKARAKAIAEGNELDWASGEALAFGSLLLEGNHVRLSGQDVERGTFSHRHAVVHDQLTEDKYTPLENISQDQARFTVSNSHLSEYGVLGFELGYSMTNPHTLVCWEGQYGDFCNTAQAVIDQYISSGETKWMRQSGLVMLLPHGYEGGGPEHSSCRVERFLQMSADDESVFPDNMEHSNRKQIQENNWQVVNCTTPAQIFHVLRRQVHRGFRKPLIVCSPKSLLRHPLAKSSLEDMEPGTRFRRLINDEEIVDPSTVRKSIFCSGKVYYDVKKARDDAGLTQEIALTRIEQIAPFPFDLVQRTINEYPNAQLSWVQEEPKNQGPWSYVHPRFHTTFGHPETREGNHKLRLTSRPASASTATGLKNMHAQEEASIISEALLIEDVDDAV